jgi:DNA polymerase III delta prime subunit
MQGLIESICKKEKTELSEEVIERIIEVADGSARMALVILDQIIGLADEDEQLSAIQAQDIRAAAIEICRTMIDPRKKWGDLAPILEKVEDDPEGIRNLILAYFTKVLLGARKGGNADRAAEIIDLFEDNFYDGKRASLVKACYYAMQRGK